MKREGLTRRDLLLKSAALGSLAVAPSLSLAKAIEGWQLHEENSRKPTPWNEIGPFYKRKAPHIAQLKRPGDPGLPVSVTRAGLRYQRQRTLRRHNRDMAG
jgi:hypothetical protein